MTHDQRELLRKGFTALLRVVAAGGQLHVNDDYDRLRDSDRTLPCFAALVGVSWPVGVPAGLPPGELTSETVLALSVLLGDPNTTEQALADYMLDHGFEYAAAVAEKAAKEERERIADRLYCEASHVLSRGPDPNDTYEFAAAALSSVADDLVMGVPPTAPMKAE